MIYRNVVTLAAKKSVQTAKNVTFRHNPNYLSFYMNHPVRSARLILNRLPTSPTYRRIRTVGLDITGFFINSWWKHLGPVVMILIGYHIHNHIGFVPANLSFDEFSWLDAFLRLYRQGILLPSENALIMKYYVALFWLGLPLANIILLQIFTSEGCSGLGFHQ